MTRVRLTKLANAAQAQLLAARLQAEGIEARVRSEAAGPYPFTVGQMAEAEVWVPDHQLGPAQEVALAAEVDEDLGRATAWQPSKPAWSWGERALALALVVIVVALFVSRFVMLLMR